MSNLEKYLTHLPALILSASKALLRAVQHQLREIGQLVSRTARKIWAAYERYEAAVTSTIADVVLAVMALRYLVIFILAPALFLAWAGYWLALISFLAFVGFATWRFFSIDQAEFQHDVESGRTARAWITGGLKIGLRLGAAALSLYLSGPWLLNWLKQQDSSFSEFMSRPWIDRTGSTNSSFAGLPWQVGELPILKGLPSGEPVVSTADLLDANGRPLPYRAQYVPVAYLKYVADTLRAREWVRVFNAPTESGNAGTSISIRPGALVRILEAYSVVESPRYFISNGGRELILPGSVSSTMKNGKVFNIRKGTTVVELHPTSGECPTFFLASVGIRNLCWTNEVKSTPAVVKTAFLVRTELGNRYWTRLFDETENANAWTGTSWATCNTVSDGKTERVECS